MGTHHHHHHHGHGHSHHDHSHGEEVTGRLLFAFFLNLGFACIELVGGFYTNSMAVLTDALHDFGDALALGLALILEKKSQQSSDNQYSYGYRRFSTFSAFITGLILVAGAVAIIAKSVPRLIRPEQPQTSGMILLALLGIAVNSFAAYKVSRGKSLNERMISWHFIEDLMGWCLLLVGAIVMHFWDVPIIDPILAIVLGCWVLWNVGKTLGETMRVFLQATPVGLEISKIEEAIKGHEKVVDAHHTHVWSIDGEMHVLTTHVIVKTEIKSIEELAQIKIEIKELLLQTFHIHESSIEFDSSLADCQDPTHI